MLSLVAMRVNEQGGETVLQLDIKQAFRLWRKRASGTVALEFIRASLHQL